MEIPSDTPLGLRLGYPIFANNKKAKYLESAYAIDKLPIIHGLTVNSTYTDAFDAINGYLDVHQNGYSIGKTPRTCMTLATNKWLYNDPLAYSDCIDTPLFVGSMCSNDMTYGGKNTKHKPGKSGNRKYSHTHANSVEGRQSGGNLN